MLGEYNRKKWAEQGALNTQSELDTNIDIPCQFHDLGELHRLLCSALQVFNHEDLQTRFVNLWL